MAINKKLIFWKSSTFNPPTSPSDTTKDVLWNSIVFFDSTAGTYANSIWTHGKVFGSGVWGTNQTNYVPLAIGNTTYNLSKDGHTHNYAGSASVGGSATTSKALIGDDTRSTNSAPSVYMSGGTRYVGYVGNQTEFKQISVIGAGTFLTGTYCFLETKNPWSDYSGGLPIQVAYGPGTPCWRIATDANTWSVWQALNSGGNADKLDGYHAATTATANTIVQRDGNGYIYGVYINSNRGDETSAAASYLYDTGDGWMRKKTLANARNELVTKTQIESVLTGNLTTHTHSYLPLAGGTLTGQINLTTTTITTPPANTIALAAKSDGLYQKIGTVETKLALTTDLTWANITSKPATLSGYGITDAILLGDTIQNTNPFGGKNLYINSLDNALAGATKKYYVTVTVHKKVVNSVTYPKAINGGNISLPQWEDSPVIDTRDGTQLFDNNYEGGIWINSDEYMKVTLNFSADNTAYFPGYPYGTYYLNYYYSSTPDKAQVRCYNGFAGHTIGYKTLDFYNYIGTNAAPNFIQQCTDGGNYQRRQIEFIIFGHPSHTTSLTEIEWKLERPSFSTHSPLFTNYSTNKSYQIFNFGTPTNDNVTINPNGNITALSFTGNLTGIATSANHLANITAELLPVTYGSYAGFLNIYGMTQGNPTDEWFHRIKMLHDNAAGYYTEIATQMTGGSSLWHRRFEAGTDYGWKKVWDSGNLAPVTLNTEQYIAANKTFTGGINGFIKQVSKTNPTEQPVYINGTGGATLGESAAIGFRNPGRNYSSIVYHDGLFKFMNSAMSGYNGIIASTGNFTDLIVNYIPKHSASGLTNSTLSEVNGVTYWGGSGQYGALSWDTGYASVLATGTNVLKLGNASYPDSIHIKNNGNTYIGGSSSNHTATKLNVLGGLWIGDYNAPQTLSIEGNIELKIFDTTIGGVKYNHVDSVNGGVTLQYRNNSVSSLLQDGLTLNYGGNVGIGTINPSTKLQISSVNASGYNPSTAGFSLQKNEEGYGLFAGVEGSGNSWLQAGTKTNGTYNLILQGIGGNVGIGTTMPQSALDIQRSYGNDVEIKLSQPGSAIWSIKNTASTGLFSIGSGGSSHLNILNSNGNVGIGTTSPNYKLDVVGTINASTSITAPTFIGTITNASALNSKSSTYYTDYDERTLGNNVNFNNITYDFQNRSFIVSPVYPQNFTGQTNTPFIDYGQMITFGGLGAVFPFQLAVSDAGKMAFRCKYRPTNNTVIDSSWWSIYHTGNSNNVSTDWTARYSYAVGFYESSDIRLKTNIKELDPSLADNINLVEFDKQGKHGYGVIAQEVEQYYPTLVTEGADGYKTVNYTELAMIKIKYLEEKIKQLEAILWEKDTIN